GHTWQLLTDSVLGNPLNGRAVSRIAVDAGNPNLIYAAVGDLATNGTGGNVGVWRYNGNLGQGFNLTSVVSVGRSTGTNPPNTPGPDDDFTITFPQSSATWSDLVLAPSGVLYAALGTSFGGNANAVYRNLNPQSNAPVWAIGAGNINAPGNSPFPHGSN